MLRPEELTAARTSINSILTTPAEIWRVVLTDTDSGGTIAGTPTKIADTTCRIIPRKAQEIDGEGMIYESLVAEIVVPPDVDVAVNDEIKAGGASYTVSGIIIKDPLLAKRLMVARL